MIAQALAAVASNSNSEQQGNISSSKANSRSLTENIEMLNSKFQSFHSHKNFADKNLDSNSMSNLHSSVNSQNYSLNVNITNQNQFNSDN